MATRKKKEKFTDPFFLEEIKVENPHLRCLFCAKSELNKTEWGPMYNLGVIFAHYFCILFSSKLRKRGTDDKGIKGFLAEDIIQKRNQANDLKCTFCGEAGATIVCCKYDCHTYFHFTCGVSQGTSHEFLDGFKSFCPRHWPHDPIPFSRRYWKCAICWEKIINERDLLWPPCCEKRVLHRKCAQEHALRYEWEDCICPYCRDIPTFRKYILQNGVYVPKGDRAWINEQHESHDSLVNEYFRCYATECLCKREKNGRDYNVPGDPLWMIVRCTGCGKSNHIKCGNIKDINGWICSACAPFRQLVETNDNASSAAGSAKVVARVEDGRLKIDIAGMDWEKLDNRKINIDVDIQNLQ